MTAGAAQAERIEIEVDDAVEALDRIDHIVVLMLENRSFDHMLGYLRLSGRRPELNGLRPEMANAYTDHDGRFPAYDGVSFPIHELLTTKMKKSQDPPHGGAAVDKQLSSDNGGFVQAYMDERGGPPEVHPRDVMGYHTEAHLPVYDHLAEKFCVCDNWFSSVPGATFPNRLYSVAGHAAGSRDNISPPIYHLESFVRHLRAPTTWGWFVHDVAPIVWAVDRDLPLNHLLDEHVAWFDGHFRPPHFGERFVQRAAGGKLPNVSWIDPSFADFRTGILSLLTPPSNDDHPPSDVCAGQALVLKLYDALASNRELWKKTMLVITYDEHGGFFDHEPPPENPPDDDPKTFSRYGVRVPALVVSPLVGRRSFSHERFDHTSIIKTILLRFCREGNTIPNMGKRVSAANHLGSLLTETVPRLPETPELYRPLADRIAACRKETFHEELVLGANERAAASPSLTDLQHDYLHVRNDFMEELVHQLPERLFKFPEHLFK